MSKMTSRERVRKAINHEPTDRVPIDLGSTLISGIHVLALVKLREALGLPHKIPKAQDPMSFVSVLDDDVRQALGVDCIGLYSMNTSLGVKNTQYKNWTLPNGTDILVAKDFAVTKDESTGDFLAYPQGDMNVPPSGRMTANAFYFDPIPRQEDLELKTDWNARDDYRDQYALFSDEDLKNLQQQSEKLFRETDYSLVGNFNDGGLGDIFAVPAPWLKYTKGIREPMDWYMGMHLHFDYIYDLFAMQTEIALKKLALYHEAVGDRVDVLVLSGTDFGHQEGLLISKELYRSLFLPFYRQMNDWIHSNTTWKVFTHSCGSTFDLIPDFIESGFDILNPVQVSAKNMEAEQLKTHFGKDIVFWGGGCDPQGVLPYGTPDEVYEQTKRNAEKLSAGGGFVGGNVHSIQYDVPAENIIAEFRALRDTKPTICNFGRRKI